MSDIKTNMTKHAKKMMSFLKNGVAIYQIKRPVLPLPILKKLDGVIMVRIDSDIISMLAYVSAFVASLLFLISLPHLFMLIVAEIYSESTTPTIIKIAVYIGGITLAIPLIIVTFLSVFNKEVKYFFLFLSFLLFFGISFI